MTPEQLAEIKDLLTEYRAERYADDGLALADHVDDLVAEVERLQAERRDLASAVRALAEEGACGMYSQPGLGLTGDDLIATLTGGERTALRSLLQEEVR